MKGTKKRTRAAETEIREAIQSAIAACRSRGAQVTPLREEALAALWLADRPVGAYDLRDRLSETFGRPISAASVYRTLRFLCDQGVAARIESRNAYVACSNSGREHASVHFVCNDCGSSTEIEDKKLERLLANDAEKLGFSIDHRLIELSGSCATCRASGN